MIWSETVTYRMLTGTRGQSSEQKYYSISINKKDRFRKALNIRIIQQGRLYPQIFNLI